MNRSLSLLILSMSLTACAQAPSSADASKPSAQLQTKRTQTMNDTLGDFHWRLQDATDARGQRIDALLIRPDLPVQFDFVDGRIRIANACNGISGDVRIDGDTLRFGALLSTKMACADPAVMALDSEVAARLQGKVRFELLESDPLQLMWTAANGDTLRFIGAPTAETRFGSPGETVFMEIAAHTKPCQHPMQPAMRQCLEVRERQYGAQGVPVGTPGEWQLFHDNIEGYLHEEGIRNVLRIRRFPIANSPMDAPAIAYVLEQSIESEMVGP